MFRSRFRFAEIRFHRLEQDQGTQERLGASVLLQGKTQTTVPGNQAGDLGCRSQAEGHADQRHARATRPTRSPSPAIKFPEPVLSYAIEPKSRG